MLGNGTTLHEIPGVTQRETAMNVGYIKGLNEILKISFDSLELLEKLTKKQEGG